MENENIHQFHFYISTTLFYEDKSLIWEGIVRWSMLHNYYTHRVVNLLEIKNYKWNFDENKRDSAI